jgi:16S rRNA (cytosine1402-N4)-methyltransferase
MSDAANHIPVMLDEVIRSLAITPGAELVDGTFGAGGYSLAMLEKGAKVYAFDRDPDALSEGADLAGRHKGALHLYAACFSIMDRALADDDIGKVDGVVLDIGVSSMQLDRAERGFSFQKDGPLDMRMGQDGETAAEFVNAAPEEVIADVIYRYGDEHRSRRIAREIVAARPIETTAQLAAIVRKSVGYKQGAPKDPATRSFQAIRIHINRELEELSDGLDAAERMLRPGGRLVVVTFHSLEDRIVKQFFRSRSGADGAVSRHMPQVADTGPEPSFLKADKALRPSEAELARNPRARSATLRAATRSDAAAWSSQEQAA